jgi:copper(I)-binding protein
MNAYAHTIPIKTNTKAAMRLLFAQKEDRRFLGLTAMEWIAVLATMIAWLPVAAFAADSCMGSVCVDQAWARATPGNAKTAAIYMTIANKGAVADKLSGASTPAAEHAQVHQTTMSGNMAHMDMVGSIDIPAGGKVTFAPDGYHVMLTDLKAPLKEGSSFVVTLEFAKSGKLDVPVSVLSAGATGPSGGVDHPGGMSGMPGIGH